MCTIVEVSNSHNIKVMEWYYSINFKGNYYHARRNYS